MVATGIYLDGIHKNCPNWDSVWTVAYIIACHDDLLSKYEILDIYQTLDETATHDIVIRMFE